VEVDLGNLFLGGSGKEVNAMVLIFIGIKCSWWSG
jgi:hypothetical protein